MTFIFNVTGSPRRPAKWRNFLGMLCPLLTAVCVQLVRGCQLCVSFSRLNDDAAVCELLVVFLCMLARFRAARRSAHSFHWYLHTHAARPSPRTHTPPGRRRFLRATLVRRLRTEDMLLGCLDIRAERSLHCSHGQCVTATMRRSPVLLRGT